MGIVCICAGQDLLRVNLRACTSVATARCDKDRNISRSTRTFIQKWRDWQVNILVSRRILVITVAWYLRLYTSA